MTILHNRIRCKKCGDVIESKHRHDFVWCSCKSVFVDGGREYIRGGWPGGEYTDWVEELHEFQEDPKPENLSPPCEFYDPTDNGNQGS